MARKYPSSELPHMWAHETAEQGESASAMYFVGRTFYSYSTPIAAIAEGVSGRKAYVLAESGYYSVTTSTHQGKVRDAVPHGSTVFIVPAVSRHGNESFGDHTQVMERWRGRIHGTLESMADQTPRKAKNTLAKLYELTATMREYVAFFGLSGDAAAIPDLPGTPAEASEAVRTIVEQRERLKREKAERERLAEAETREQWLRGENVHFYSRQEYADLRIVGDNVETSMGATFPVSHAKRGLALVEAVMERGEEWKTNGHSCYLGHYKIDRITPDGTVYAGCHVVKYEAIQRIADQLRAAPTTEE